jgi:hypothetical protein
MYSREPFLQKVILHYPTIFNADEIVNYFKTKKSIRNGTPIKNTTCVAQISKFKSVLKKIKDIPELNQLSIPEMTKTVKNYQHQRLIKSHQQVVEVPRQIVNDILNGIQSDNIAEVYVALLLGSGRRPSELYNMPLNYDDGNELVFKGQLKKRGNSKEYTIKLLVENSMFSTALNRFLLIMRDTDGLSPAEISNKYKNNHSNYLYKMSEKYNMKITSSLLRRLYGLCLYETYADNETLNHFLMKNLGHDNLAVSLNYNNIKLV